MQSLWQSWLGPQLNMLTAANPSSNVYICCLSLPPKNAAAVSKMTPKCHYTVDRVRVGTKKSEIDLVKVMMMILFIFSFGSKSTDGSTALQ